MSSLFASLAVAREALQAQQMGLQITQNNISNVNTPGYTRQRPSFVPGDPVAEYGYDAGMGVRLDSIDSYRDRMLDYRLNQEAQRQGEYSYASSALQQVESVLNEQAGAGLQSALAAFFNSFASLANAPEDASLRTQVLAQGEQLAAQFKSTYERIQSVATMQEHTITGTVEEINAIASSISRLNGEIAAVPDSIGNQSTLRDQRQQLLEKLAGLVDVAYFETESGAVTVMSKQGALLVAGTQSYAWSASTGSDGFMRITSQGADVTSKIESGKLGGLLEVRDRYVAGYLKDLDDLAAAVMQRVNEEHAQGADLDGNGGGDFFVPFVSGLPGSNAGAARSMTLAIEDPSLIAAAEAGAGPGSNANAARLAAILDGPMEAGGSITVNQFYANLVFKVGLDVSSMADKQQTQEYLLTQLRNQRDAVSGVSLDEEAVDLMRYQKAYEANARFISLVDQLTEDLMQLLGG